MSPHFAKATLPETCAPYLTLHEAIVLLPGALSRTQKESIHLAVAQAGAMTTSTAPESALIGFAVTLALDPTAIGRTDFDRLRDLGFTDEEILEAILAASLARFHRTLADGLGSGRARQRSPVRNTSDRRLGRPCRPRSERARICARSNGNSKNSSPSRTFGPSSASCRNSSSRKA